MSSKKLEAFLKALAQNPALAERYKNDPTGVMNEHGVDAKHQDMILKGDKAAVQRELGGSDAVPIMTIDSYKQ